MHITIHLLIVLFGSLYDGLLRVSVDVRKSGKFIVRICIACRGNRLSAVIKVDQCTAAYKYLLG